MPALDRHQAVEQVTVPLTVAKFPLLFVSSPKQKDPHSMTISMYKISVPIFVQFLTSMSAVLDMRIEFPPTQQNAG